MLARATIFDSQHFGGVSKYYLFDGEHWIMEWSGLGRRDMDGQVREGSGRRSGRRLSQYDATGANISNVLYGLGIDEIIARGVSGQPQWPLPDRNGNTSVVTTDGGAILEQYRYDAFGAPTITDANGAVRSASAIQNPFLFTGREWAPANLGFYEYRNRAYHPGLGRFLSEDPIGFDPKDYNLFRYVGNDPLDRTDPMGLEPVEVDPAVDRLAQQASSRLRNITYVDSQGYRREAGTSVFRNRDTPNLETRDAKRGVSVPGKKQQTFFAKEPSDRHIREADIHSHTSDTPDKKTGSLTSAGDVKRGNFTGKPVYTTAEDKNGRPVVERYRPSDAKTIEARKAEGGVIEKIDKSQWKRTGN